MIILNTKDILIPSINAENDDGIALVGINRDG